MPSLPSKPHMQTLMYYYLPPKTTFSQIHSSITKESIWQFWSVKVGNKRLHWGHLLFVSVFVGALHLSIFLPHAKSFLSRLYTHCCVMELVTETSLWNFIFKTQNFKGPAIKVLKVFQYTFYVVTKEKLRNTFILCSFDCYNNCQYIWLKHANGWLYYNSPHGVYYGTLPTQLSWNKGSIGKRLIEKNRKMWYRVEVKSVMGAKDSIRVRDMGSGEWSLKSGSSIK